MNVISAAFLLRCTLALSLTACSSAAAGGASATDPAAMSPNAPPAADGLAGQYRGTFSDRKLGAGKTTITLSQTGHSAGGTMRFEGRASLVRVVALDTTNHGDISGIAVEPAQPCTFSVAASYDRTSLVLKGTYSATRGCLGQRGSFSAKEECYYAVAKPAATAAAPNIVPKPC